MSIRCDIASSAFESALRVLTRDLKGLLVHRVALKSYIKFIFLEAARIRLMSFHGYRKYEIPFLAAVHEIFDIIEYRDIRHLAASGNALDLAYLFRSSSK